MGTIKRKTKGIADDVDIYVGKRLRIQRTLLGMSQEKLATAIGITFQQIQKYERGVNRISASRLLRFSQNLNVPITYFFEKYLHTDNAKPAYGLSDNEQAEYGNGEDLLQSKETIDVLRVYYSIKDVNARKDALKSLKLMAKNFKD